MSVFPWPCEKRDNFYQTIAFLVQKMSKPAELTLPTPSDALTISAFSNCCVATLAEKKYLSGIPNFDAKLTVKF